METSSLVFIIIIVIVVVIIIIDGDDDDDDDPGERVDAEAEVCADLHRTMANHLGFCFSCLRTAFLDST